MRFLLILNSVVIFAACKGDANPAAAPSPRGEPPRALAAPQPQRHLSERVHPAHTFDLLSEPIAPGASTTQTVTLADGWAVTGKPQVVGGGFVVDSAETSAAPDGEAKLYTVKARNDGKTSARFVADVPCSGCP